MATKEELLEGFYNLSFMPDHFQYYECGGTISLGYTAVKKIMIYLDSQGLVLKVERELPSLPDASRCSPGSVTWNNHMAAFDYQQVMIKSGFSTAVEPLII